MVPEFHQNLAGVRRHEHRRLLDLPAFNGAPEDWPKFSHAFRNTTEAYGYDDVENLQRLQKSLSGAAEQAVESLLIHPAHVGHLMETLRDTFGHPNLLIRSQIQRVQSLQPVSESHLERLVPFANVVRNVATYLDMPDTQNHLANPTLLDELVAKLPMSRRIEWAGVASQIRYPTVRDFSHWLSNVARLVNLIAPMSSLNTQVAATSHYNAPARSGDKQQVTKRVMLNAANDNLMCNYCEKSHDIRQCRAYKRLAGADRWRAVKERSLCFGCLGTGHILPSCDEKRKCSIDGCDRWHHVSLHERSEEGRVPNTAQRDNSGQGNGAVRKSNPVGKLRSGEKSVAHVQFAANVSDSASNSPDIVDEVHVGTCQEGPAENSMLFRVIPIVLHGSGRNVHTYALLDEGSSVTLLDESLAEELQLEGPTANLSMKWFGKTPTVLRSRRLTLGISGSFPNAEEFVMNVRTIRNLSLPTQTVNTESLFASNPHLRDVPLVSYRNATPRILIGLDNHHLGVPREVRTDPDEQGLVAARTKLGWVVYGSDGPTYLPRASVFLIDGERDENYELLDEVVRSFIMTDDFGVKQPQSAIESDADIRARSILHATTKRVGERFETGLLWRTDDTNLPASFNMALRRLVSIEAKMRREPNYAAQYVAQVKSYVEKGYARKLSAEEARRSNGRTWYLPHFAVQNPNKPGKFRLVFDAAAKVQGVSLNSSLLSGPDVNVPLARLLFQFRLGEVGVCADIREMFHQVRIREEDRSSQRFLWRDGYSSSPPDVYEMSVMTFGATCSPASAQHVKNTNAVEFEEDYPDAADAICKRHYVDDYVASFSSSEEAARVSADVVELHRRGGFELRGFVSNSRSVLEALGASTGPADPVELEPDAAFEKILGMTWNTADDTFRFRTRFPRVEPGVLDGTKRPTKRAILSTSMSVFDPYGLLADFMLPPKLMVQDLYRAGLDWDDSAPDDICARWEAWRVEIGRTKLLRVPRCPFTDVSAITNLQLHVFADASELGFAAVAYWRITRGDNVTLSFVTGKVKVAPTPIQSIPRLELNAAVLATRLLDEIRRSHENLRFEKVVMWSDSETVLKWIRSDQRRYKQYVGFRVAEIAESTSTSWWRWVPTSMNVADDGTRIRSPPRFDPESRWLWGPAWLREDEETWPREREASSEAEKCPEEVRSKYVGIAVCQPPIDYARFSSFHRICRTIAWIIRFQKNALSRGKKQQRCRGELSATEVDDAMKRVCRMVQLEAYGVEYAALKSGKTLQQSSPIFVLKPYVDEEGLMRLHGRSDAAADEHLGPEARRPILMPRNHHFTFLIVRSHHERMAHQLIEATIASVRQRFWVPQIRVLVRSVQQACQSCKNRRAAPVPPSMGQLPLDRLTPYGRPFASTGMDYFGPVTIKIGRRHEKRWVALFTCMAVRAVHLEIAANLSTDACLVCIRNLCNLRGIPGLIRCDNGTNFVGARNVLDKEAEFFDPEAVRRELTTRGIEWQFNCPGNPEAGGAWERLVQSIKRVLSVTLSEAAPEVETLRAHLLEAANIINSRPLTHIPVESTEDEPITPNHFLLGGSNLATTPNPEEPRSLCSREQWVRSREMTRRFWEKWIRDYLPELTRRSKHYPEQQQMKIDDLVVVCDPTQPRSRWSLGRVLRTTVGADGKVRTAMIRTKDGEYWRPVTKLALMDVGLPPIVSTDGARDVAN